MIDLKLIVNNKAEVIESLKKRKFKDLNLIDKVIELNEKRLVIQKKSDELREERNQLSGKFASATPEERVALKEKGTAIATEIKALTPEFNEIEETLKNILLVIPNIIRADVPEGEGEEDNPELRKWGEIPTFDFEPKEHFDLPIKGIRLDAAAKISGSRFVVYTHKVAQLMRALSNLMLNLHAKNNYIEVQPPVLVRRETMVGSGQLPKFEDDAYKTSDDLFLIPTSEVSLINLHRDETLMEDQLPIYYTAFTPCFRKESGSYGKDTKGVIRMHQFNKVELVKFVKPENDAAELDKMVANVEQMLQTLGLPYRVVVQCTGDMGFTSHITYDLEVWFPGQSRYREISSVSTTKDFQSRRANIRYRNKETKKVNFLHTLNGSGLGMDRAIASILENYQQADGSVKVPEALVPYCGFDTIEAI